MATASHPDLAWPPIEALLSAIRGHHVGIHPITQWAHHLGEIHLGLLHHHAAVIESAQGERLETIRQINRWLRAHAPTAHPAARPCPEPVGELVDRIAAAQVLAYRLLMTRSGDDQEVHYAWTALAILVVTWNDLVTGIDRGSYSLEAGESVPPRPHNHRRGAGPSPAGVPRTNQAVYSLVPAEDH